MVYLNLKSVMLCCQYDCWWCLRNAAICQTSALCCGILKPGMFSEFENWRKWLKEGLSMNGYVNNCHWCQLPKVYDHNHTERELCLHSDNTLPVVFCILRDPDLYNHLIQIYPQASNIDTVEFRTWLMKDILQVGDSGMVRILCWWFGEVCGVGDPAQPFPNVPLF